jgi:hypothetical protein
MSKTAIKQKQKLTAMGQYSGGSRQTARVVAAACMSGV